MMNLAEFITYTMDNLAGVLVALESFGIYLYLVKTGIFLDCKNQVPKKSGIFIILLIGHLVLTSRSSQY